jgi:hypothetical protein
LVGRAQLGGNRGHPAALCPATGTKPASARESVDGLGRVVSPPGQDDDASSSVFTLATMLGSVARRVARAVARGSLAPALAARPSVGPSQKAMRTLLRIAAEHNVSMEIDASAE